MSISNINPVSVSSGSVTTSSPVSNLSVERKESYEEKTVDAGDKLSGVSSFAMAMHLSELSLSSTTTQFAYRSDNSLAIQAKSQVNFTSKSEEYRFDITLTAESMGMTEADFTDPTKPMTIKLLYSQSEMNISQKITIQEIETLRKPEEIIRDLVSALTEVFKDGGNKTVSYVLDSEAMRALAQSDPKLSRLFGELVMIMAMVNLMKKQGEDRNDYTILLSGKGKSYLDVQQEIKGEMLNQTYEFNINVLPPKSGKETKPVEIEPVDNESNPLESAVSPLTV
jgi:hypothetical protein